jgi:DNA adenine methylase
VISQTVHRQFGSKARSAERLLQLVPGDVQVWVEVFAGTAAMTLAKPPHPAEHLNDLNGDVVNLFKVMRDPVSLDRLCALLDLTPYAQEEFERCRSEVWVTDADDAMDPVARSRRFLVASWQSIGGAQITRSNWRLDLGRSSLIGTWSRLPLRLQLAARRLKLCHIHRRHVRDMVAMFGRYSGALLFLDPPYPVDSRGTHETMYAVEMDAGEHAALAKQLRRVQSRALLTISEGTVYSDILADWHATPYPVRGLRNAVKTELALTNYRPPADDLLCRGAAQ